MRNLVYSILMVVFTVPSVSLGQPTQQVQVKACSMSQVGVEVSTTCLTCACIPTAQGSENWKKHKHSGGCYNNEETGCDGSCMFCIDGTDDCDFTDTANIQMVDCADWTMQSQN